MKVINVHKAQYLPENSSAAIVIDIELPLIEREDGEELLAFFQRVATDLQTDADALEEILHSVLPGGTYDRLAVNMLHRKASHFVVAHDG